MASKDFICPKCHEMFWSTPGEIMLDHIIVCKNDSDVITTKWYTIEELKNKSYKIIPEKVITTTIIKRPSTR